MDVEWNGCRMEWITDMEWKIYREESTSHARMYLPRSVLNTLAQEGRNCQFIQDEGIIL